MQKWLNIQMRKEKLKHQEKLWQMKKTIKWYLDNQEWVNEVVSGDYQKYYNEMYGKK